MTAIIEHKKPGNSSQSSSKKTFDRLTKKLKTLQNRFQKQQQELDRSLRYYYEYILPEKKALSAALIEFVKTLYDAYKNHKKLSKADRANLKGLMLDKVDRIFASTPYQEVDPQITVIFEELSGVTYDDVIVGELENMRDDLQDMCESMGIPIDVSDIDLEDDREEVLRKLREAFHDAKENMEEPAPKPKSKKQLQKEQKEKELKELQNKGLNSIYKQLAKVFHPDLEQDKEKKSEKEELMKKLTNAYENDDLHTLLSLQMHWINQPDSTEISQSEEQLKIYNSILKDQVDELEESIATVSMHPKYMPLQAYSDIIAFEGLEVLSLIQHEIQVDVKQFKAVVNQLQSPQGESAFKAILRELNNVYTY